MNTRNRLSTLAIGVAAMALSAAASAQFTNPDNDSRAYFKYVARPAAAPVVAVMPNVGDLSGDGFYIYKGSDQGWQVRGHTYELRGGQFVHTADCVAYGAPKATKSGIPAPERGTFGDHAA